MLSDISSHQLANVTTRVVDARNLTSELGKETFTHVLSTFMLQTITTPLVALQEMYSVLVPKGVIGIGIWGQRNGPFEIWERACKALDPSYELIAPFDDPHAWRTRQELEKVLKEVGFNDVRSEEVKIPFEFESTEAFLRFWFEAKNPAAEKSMSNWKGKFDEVRKEAKRIVREDYGNGKEIYTWAVLGVGVK